MEAVAGVDGNPGVGYPVEPRELPPPIVDDFPHPIVKDSPHPSKPKKVRKKKKSKDWKSAECTEDAAIDDDLFKAISNPEKMLPAPKAKTRGHKATKTRRKTRGTSVDSMTSLSEYSSGAGASSIGLGSFRSEGSNLPYDEGSYASPASADSFDNREHFVVKKRKEEIMQEKIEMLTRISKMSKKGFTTTRKWGMRDNIDEIRFECYRMTRESNSKKAVKNMQHGLITLATILEFANNVINPFNLKLQGFSRNMMLTVSDYDESLEEIHHKWSGRTTIGPELNVLLTFATSAVFHHAGNVTSSKEEATSRHQQAKIPTTGLGDMSSMLGLFSNIMGKGGSGPTPVETPGPDVAVKAENPQKRRSMRGPRFPSASIDLPE